MCNTQCVCAVEKQNMAFILWPSNILLSLMKSDMAKCGTSCLWPSIMFGSELYSPSLYHSCRVIDLQCCIALSH
eukprot:c29497_g1_i1 orf=868-1089(+)